MVLLCAVLWCIQVTLLDTLRKRCDFLRAAAEQCGASNVEVVWSRAEDGGRNPVHRDVRGRGVARRGVWWCARFVPATPLPLATG